MRQFTSAALLLLLVLSTTIPTIPLAAREEKALIISNEYDMKAADLLEIELSKLGFTVEVDNAMKDGYDYYFILGGPLAKDVGRISRKYLPSEETQALINVKGYWTFTVKPEKGHVVVIAGNTREETFQATRLLVERGIIRFITDRSINIAPPLSSQEIRNVTTLRYQWKFPPKVGKDYEISVQIPLPLVDFFKVKPRMKVAEFNESRGTLIFTWYLMVRTPHDDPYISSLVEEMGKLAERDGIKDYRKLWFIASFVQHLRYSLASEFSKTGDYPSYPIETLYRGAGDCEDLSILLIALYRQAGYDSALLIMPAHAAVAVSMPPEWVKWPRVKTRLVDFEGTPVVLVDLNDLLNKFMTNDVVALEFELDGKKYYYVETTGFFKPGILPDLVWLANEIGWPYSEFPLFVVRMDSVAVPLIANYTIVSRKIGDGYGVTVIAKVANVGEERSVDLKLASQIYPLSQVQVGGNDPHLIRLGEASERFTFDKRAESLNIGEIPPGEVRIVGMNFYTKVSEMGAGIAISFQESNLDFIRIKPFRP